MQILVEISDEFVVRAADLGLTPEVYAHELLSGQRERSDSGQNSSAEEIDAGLAKFVPWEQIVSRLRSRIAS